MPAFKKSLESPTVLAALVVGVTTVSVALSGTIAAGISAYFQRQTDREKAQIETKRLLLGAAVGNMGTIPERLKLFIDAGLIDDRDCKLHRIYLKDEACVPR